MNHKNNLEDCIIFENEISAYLSNFIVVAYKFTKNIEDAQDLVQDTILAILKKRNDISELKIRDIAAYIIKSIRNAFFDLKKRKKSFVILNSMPHESYENDHYENESAEKRKQALRRELAFLPEQYKNVLMKFFFEKKSLKEISVELGIKTGTVKSRLYMAKKVLKVRIEKTELNKEIYINPPT